MTDGTTPSHVCEHCFDDSVLVEVIRETGSSGLCPCCGQTGRCIELSEIADYFRDAVSQLYEPASLEDGETIGSLLQHDWEIFSEALDDLDVIQVVTVAILCAGLRHKELYTDHPEYDGFFRHQHFWLEEHWDERVGKTLDGSDASSTPSEFSDAFVPFLEDLATTLDESVELYRARIHKTRSRLERFGIGEIGSPPADSASAGRANVDGEPVLYLASDEGTALAEVRAWRGMAVAIGRFRPLRPLSIVSLVDLPQFESPFGDELIGWRVQLRVLAWRLATDLATPMLPNDDKNRYRPTQYLASEIRRLGYDGFSFPSAMSDGTNIVVFDESLCEVLEPTYKRIQDVHFKSETITDGEVLYPAGPYDGLLE